MIVGSDSPGDKLQASRSQYGRVGHNNDNAIFCGMFCRMADSIQKGQCKNQKGPAGVERGQYARLNGNVPYCRSSEYLDKIGERRSPAWVYFCFSKPANRAVRPYRLGLGCFVHPKLAWMIAVLSRLF